MTNIPFLNPCPRCGKPPEYSPPLSEDGQPFIKCMTVWDFGEEGRFECGVYSQSVKVWNQQANDYRRIEHIISVAIYHKGAIISLPAPARHHTILHSISLLMKLDAAEIGTPDNQGFLTSTGRFVNRVEGYYIARKAGQMIKNSSGAPELYSEDLW